MKALITFFLSIEIIVSVLLAMACCMDPEGRGGAFLAKFFGCALAAIVAILIVWLVPYAAWFGAVITIAIVAAICYLYNKSN